MSIVSRLKRLKLKKLQPGKIIKGVVDIAATAGVPGAGAAKKVVDRVGKKVESVDRAWQRDKAKYAQVLREGGAGSVLDGSNANPNVPTPSPELAIPTSSSNGMVIGLVAIVAVLFLMKSR